ncbi:clusterin-associated protein 1 [Anabrus simplex]|uniref:clusterin-associated protein 1 n=1 Tax=Anabrus simplex TaxID=316456 RepID=UPI0035A381AD
MSYRDIRNFIEMMKSLGFTRHISMENFRTPNFPLVAEILVWLVKQYDPSEEIPLDIETESERVMLVRSVAHFMAVKVQIKLNTKLVYQADGYAVREMLKAAAPLYSSLQENIGKVTERVSDYIPEEEDLSTKMEELKQARLLATEITTQGATIYDLLSREVEMREIRKEAVNNPLEIAEVETIVRKGMEKLQKETINLKQQMENVTVSEASLDSKIEKKRLELERSQKRLQTLKKVRPPFMEEFERLEVDLRRLYEEFLVRFRCLAYLEQQQEDTEKAEQERMEERQAATKKLLEQFKQEETVLEGSGDVFSLGDGDIKEEGDEIGRLPGKASRVRIQTASRVMRKASAGVQQRRVFGSMSGPTGDDEDSLDSDSDLLLDGEGSELLGSEEEEEEEDIELGPDGLALVTNQRPKQTEQHSDDDF